MPISKSPIKYFLNGMFEVSLSHNGLSRYFSFYLTSSLCKYCVFWFYEYKKQNFMNTKKFIELLCIQICVSLYLCMCLQLFLWQFFFCFVLFLFVCFVLPYFISLLFLWYLFFPRRLRKDSIPDRGREKLGEGWVREETYSEYIV